MSTTIVIEGYLLKRDYLGDVVSAPKLLEELRNEISEAGYMGIAPRCIVFGIDLETGLYKELIELYLRNGKILSKGDAILVWKKV